MNNKQRKKLNDIHALLTEYHEKMEPLYDELYAIYEEESEKTDNMPEGFLESDKGQKIQEASENLDYATDFFGEVKDSMDQLLEYIEKAKE